MNTQVNIVYRDTLKMDYTIITDGADCYPWQETFVILPKKTITGKRLAFQKLYRRRVWVVWGTGFHMEPETQYATLFELLSHQDQDLAG